MDGINEFRALLAKFGQMMPEVAKRNGAMLVIVNQQPTEADSIADLVLHARIGGTMGAVLQVVGEI